MLTRDKAAGAEQVQEFTSPSRELVLKLHTREYPVFIAPKSKADLEAWSNAYCGVQACSGDGSAVVDRKSMPKRPSGSVFGDLPSINISDVVMMAKLRLASVHGFGRGDSGQLGVGTKVLSGAPKPAKCSSLKGKLAVQHISVGLQHSAGVTIGGQLLTWGANDFFQLGEPSIPNTLRPQLVSSLRRVQVRSVACGAHHTLLCTTEGRVHAWGENTFMQCSALEGTENRDGSAIITVVKSPTALSAFGPSSPALASCVFAGPAASAVVDSHGRAWVWGLNESGQLGLGYQGDGSASVQQALQDTDMKLDFRDPFLHLPACFLVQQPTVVNAPSVAGRAITKVALAFNFTLWQVVSQAEYIHMRWQAFAAPWADNVGAPVTDLTPEIATAPPSKDPAEVDQSARDRETLSPPAPSFGLDPFRGARSETQLMVSGRPGRSYYVWDAWRQVTKFDTTVPYLDPLFGQGAVCSDIATGICHGAIASRGRIFTIGHGYLGLMTGSALTEPLPNAPSHFVNSAEETGLLDTDRAQAVAESWFAEEPEEDKLREEVEMGGWPAVLPYSAEPGSSQAAFHPLLCTTMQLEGVVQVACGERHTVGRTRDGRMFSFGSNSAGQLGLGTFVTGLCPAVSASVLRVPDMVYSSVAAGGQTTLSIVVRGHSVVESADRRRAKQAALKWWERTQRRLKGSRGQQRRLSMFVHSELQGLSLDDFAGGGAAASETKPTAARSEKSQARTHLAFGGISADPAGTDTATESLDALVGSMLDSAGLFVAEESEAQAQERERAANPNYPWECHHDEDGNPYFYNVETEEAQWEPPASWNP